MNINTKKYIENYVKIKDKNSRIVPFYLNEPQMKLYNLIKSKKKEHKPIRIIILKARQMGFSTLTEAILFKEVATKHNVNAGIITHKEEATTNLFNMSKLIYNYLPEEIKPSQQKSNAKELIFNNKTNTGLNSKIKCMTAGGKGVGRSDTFNFLHLSELAFWQGDKEETYSGLMQSVPNNENSIVIIESTANGYEFFKSIWDKAVSGENDYIPLFVSWAEMPEYSMPYSGFELTSEEKELQQLYNLSLDQLTWRRWCIANNCNGNLDKFKQEYPINPQEAFISTGKCVFDKNKIINRIQSIPKPLKVGYFSYDYDDTLQPYGAINPYTDKFYDKNKISNIKWINDTDGPIQIYELPDSPQVSVYGIGGDTAGEGSDYFTAHVINKKTLKQVARFRSKLDSDLYTKQMYCLGMYYKYALIGIEKNFDSFPIRELERLGYLNQFIIENEDEYTHKPKKVYGFRTDKITRPAIINYLVELVREHIELINDKETLSEMLQFIKNENGRPEAEEGAHDDLVMALAISYRIIQQVNDISTVINVKMQDEFKIMQSSYSNQDYGEKIEII